METFYIAKRNLLIPNAPGQIPSSVRVKEGARFALDGTEPVNVPMLLRLGQIVLAPDAFDEKPKKRRVANAKPNTRQEC